ncbi:MAG: UDP-N-acetylmuramoyl-L-alanyl-D-glutamate--2,6-diaminopimelate ligase [Phycisphaeraceae bacterium]|nr:UDP-N-acetylmuramoyl-L-alanyl-D-glutamate--2,6-diaminopimelate ligase [Phycisphaeraceae bacterium]
MNLGVLIEGLDVRGASGVPPAALRICDITDDSRTVVPGSLFIARAGTKADGRKFVPEAISAGAVAILTDDPGLKLPAKAGAAVVVTADVPRIAAAMAERFYGSPTARLDLVGITGTNGKTTTAHLVHQLLNGAGVRCGLIGTVVIDDGVETAAATLTTPPATELSRTFGRMVEAGCQAAVMEVSSHALDQGRVAALHFDIGVFTNLTGDHLDYHKTMEAYAAAKAKLFEMLPAEGWAVVNVEDAHAPRMLRECRARVMRCRVEDGPGPMVKWGAADDGHMDCRATVREMTMNGTRVVFTGPWGAFETTVRLLGRHNVMNALQAVCAAYAAGVQPVALERNLSAAVAPPGRLEPVTTPADPFAVLVDYAHTDDAMRKVLAAVGPLVKDRGKDGGGRLSIVFGCGGDRDQSKRARMGAAAAEMADLVYVTSDNPRTERASDIISQILEGIPGEVREAGRVMVDADRKRAIQRAIEEARAGDILLIAGKGHETYQIVSDGRGGTISHHFDDREAARAALAQRRHSQA